MKREIEVLTMIAENAKKDVEQFEGKPFNGVTVAEYFGCHAASIRALANILKSILEEENK